MNTCEHLTVDDLKLVPFTVAFIKEALRLHPAVPFVRRIVQKEHTFGDYTIPKGVAVLLPLFYLNCQDFEKADQFLPERYINEGRLLAVFVFFANLKFCRKPNTTVLCFEM